MYFVVKFYLYKLLEEIRLFAGLLFFWILKVFYVKNSYLLKFLLFRKRGKFLVIVLKNMFLVRWDLKI